MYDCCANQCKACGLSASIGHAYWHLFVSKHALLISVTFQLH